MDETSWVRTIYLYGMCVVGFALIGFGAVGAVLGLVHTISPDLGHRDTLDRVGIGVSNIAEDVIDLAAGFGIDTEFAEDFCRDITDNDEEFDECVAEETGAAELDAIKEGIAEVRGELESQIRYNSIDQLIRGLLMAMVGLVLFRIHGPRTNLYADGVMPEKAPPSSPPPPQGATAAPPAAYPPPTDQPQPPPASF